MADIFLKNDAINLLSGKNIVFFGDSNMRHLYKDLVWLIKNNTIIPDARLRKRLEKSFEGDCLVDCTPLTAGRGFKENRKFTSFGIQLEYFFITRVLGNELTKYINSVKTGATRPPEIIVMNSTLWDLTRWGPTGVEKFKTDIRILMKLLNDVLPSTSMFIWTTTLPPGKNIRKGSLLIKQVDFLQHTVRFDVMEANFYAKNVVTEFGYDVLDMHFHLRMQIHRRQKDGLHFQPLPIRLLTNLLLTHLALSLNYPLPRNIDSTLLQRYESMSSVSKEDSGSIFNTGFKVPESFLDSKIMHNIVSSSPTKQECTVKVIIPEPINFKITVNNIKVGKKTLKRQRQKQRKAERKRAEEAQQKNENLATINMQRDYTFDQTTQKANNGFPINQEVANTGPTGSNDKVNKNVPLNNMRKKISARRRLCHQGMWAQQQNQYFARQQNYSQFNNYGNPRIYSDIRHSNFNNNCNSLVRPYLQPVIPHLQNRFQNNFWMGRPVQYNNSPNFYSHKPMFMGNQYPRMW